MFFANFDYIYPPMVYMVGKPRISASIWHQAIKIWCILQAVRISVTDPDRLLNSSWHCVIDSVTVSLCVFFSDLSNSETVAATLWERVQNLWWAWAQKYVLERAVFWRISPPTHMKSILRGLLGSQVHHRGAGRSFSITLPDTSCLKCVGSSICSVLASIGFVLKTRYISAALN